MSTSVFVLAFADIGIGDRLAVGGKGASLGELTRAGIRVPPGFVVTTAAFERALAALDPGGAIRRQIQALPADDHFAISSATAAIRGRMEQVPLPEEIRSAIVDSYSRLGLRAGAADASVPVAVRSSATSEDSAEASFAGLQDTYLWVRGENAVVAHVRRCWASLYSVESVSYRLRLRLPEKGLAMGVVVQRMVDARSSGVMFTRSPTTGDRSVVAIEASWGLGSAVVSGEVTPDTYVVNKVTGEIVKRTVSIKTRWHRPNANAAGVLDEDVPEHLQNEPCLSDDEVRQLAEVARRVERHYGTPQDIEWAIAHDLPAGEHLFLLQSRPETVWAGRDAAPVAAPKGRAFDHVMSLFGGAAAAADAAKREGEDSR